MISKQEDIVDLFNILHDGEILDAEFSEGTLNLKVGIGYLANRVNPNFDTFQVTLKEVENLSFRTWPRLKDEEPSLLNIIDDIFKPPLDILESNLMDNGYVEIICNQKAVASDFCGGNLQLKTTGAIVRDESGKQYSIDELGTICEEYWDEWKKRWNKNDQ